MKAFTALFALTMLLVGGCKNTGVDTGTGTATPSRAGSATTDAVTTGAAPAAKPPGAVGGEVAEGVEIAVTCGSIGRDYEACKAGVDAWSARTGNKVRLVVGPSLPTEMLALYLQLLGAEATEIDVYILDILWPGILGTFFIDLKEYSKGAENSHFQSIIVNNTIDRKLVAMPWSVDAGILYYRKDLLVKYGEKVPTTWRELARTARKIQDAERKAGNKGMWGFVFQGAAYEGLTCDALEWVASYGGGTIVDADGKVTIDNPEAAAALDAAASWIGTIAPKGVLSYQEEESRGVFQSGNAVFMRNWTYAYELSQAENSRLKGKVGIAALPKGSGPNARSAATLGGWSLGVSTFSRHKEAAADLVLYLTGPEEQKRRAVEAGLQPTIERLYQDKEVLQSNPSFTELFDALKNAVLRPASSTCSNNTA